MDLQRERWKKRMKRHLDGKKERKSSSFISWFPFFCLDRLALKFRCHRPKKWLYLSYARSQVLFHNAKWNKQTWPSFLHLNFFTSFYSLFCYFLRLLFWVTRAAIDTVGDINREFSIILSLTFHTNRLKGSLTSDNMPFAGKIVGYFMDLTRPVI